MRSYQRSGLWFAGVGTALLLTALAVRVSVLLIAAQVTMVGVAVVMVRTRAWADDVGIHHRPSALGTRTVRWEEIAQVDADYLGREVEGLRLQLRGGDEVAIPLATRWSMTDRHEFEGLIAEHLGDDRLVVHPPWGPGRLSRSA